MRFDAYLAQSGIPAKRAADELGVAVSTISRWLTGKRTPEDEWKERIFHWSDGAVTPNDWFDLPRQDDAMPADAQEPAPAGEAA